MPKNIVLLSDGTGNSSAKLFTTNVWRLYQALNLGDPISQIAFYDNGVGTSSFKPLAFLGGIFGFGLKRNVIAIYSFLCRNYHDGDRIFGFGFSRGAFTIRIVAGLVAREGLVRYTGDEAQLARYAKAAYRHFREGFTTTTRIEVPLRWVYHSVRNLFTPPVPMQQRHWPRIRFLGLWDTVAAYGGPIEEITRAIDFGIFPLSMPDRYMSDKIDRACHALALDDERRAFWPVLWDEFHVVDSNGKIRPNEENWSPPEAVARPLSEIDRQRLSQVWFAGMHADVGGGYPQAGLSYVTLEWMMDRALVYGLLFKPQEFARLRGCADEYDKLNDSRHGLAGYYRYQPRRVVPLLTAEPTKANIPRDIGYLWQWMKDPLGKDPQSEVDNGLYAGRVYAGNVYSPKIHESVFQRIAAGTDGYSPIVIPATYRVTTKVGRILSGQYESDSQAENRARRQERVWNWVWGRRVAYFATLLVSLTLAATPLLLLKWPGNGEASLAAFLIPVIDVVGRFLPSFASYWLDAFKQAPTWLLLGGAALAALLFVGGRLQQHIHDKMRPLWRENVSAGPQPVAASPLPSDPLYRLRSSRAYRGFFYTLTIWVLPGVCLLAIVYGLFAGINRVLFSVEDSLGIVCAGSSAPIEAKGQEMTFATKTLCHPTNVTVTKNQTYLITLKIIAPWRDGYGENGIATDPNGFNWTKMTWKMWSGVPMRRLMMENWFQIVARVGSQGLDEQVVTTEHVPGEGAAAPTVFAGKFTAKDSGEVFLFVNDAVIGLPGLMNVFYANNAGEAIVTIQPAT
jgi:uncharacterized protein (DUF2235 family)